MKSYITALSIIISLPAYADVGTSNQEGAGADLPIPNTSMCVDPPSIFPHIWYIDPVGGATQSGGGDGSAAHPWNSLQAVNGVKTAGIFGPVPGYTQPLLSTVTQGTGGGTGPIHPGDEILLMTGNYGAVSFGFDFQLTNSAYVTIAAAPGQTPNLYSLFVTNATMFNFVGLTVSGISSPASARNQLIQVSNSSTGITHDIRLSKFKVYSADDATRDGWSQADWSTFARTGVALKATSAGLAYCLRFSNSEIKNTIGASVSLFSDNSILDNNEIHDWSTDAVDFAASNLIIKNNYVHDVYMLGDGSHVDAMQGFVGRPSYSDVLIEGNFVNYATKRHNFDTVTAVLNGGIGETDQDWNRVTIKNNVVVFPQHNIAWSDCRDCIIEGNTTLPARLFQDTDQHGGEILFNGQSKTFSISSNAIIKNNYTTFLVVTDPNAIVKYNVMSTVSMPAGSHSGLYIGGVFVNDGTLRGPGTFGDHNVSDTGGILSEIVAFDNSTTFTFDFHLLSSATARGAGSNTLPMPRSDIEGYPRIGNDVGAYAFH